MAIMKGIVEMLQMADKEPRSFNDFTKIVLNSRHLSSTTVAKRLEELVFSKVVEEVIVRSKTGRRIIGYRTTEKGRRVIAIAKELEEALVNSKSK